MKLPSSFDPITCRFKEKPICFSRRQYYIFYSFIFILSILLTYGCYFLNGKSFIWRTDGLAQHYRALVYYAKWLRTIIRPLISEHQLEIPTYSFSIGYGSDILTTLHYYVIGDPLCLLSVFIPTRYMAQFYTFLILLRLYLSGIAFSAFCFYMQKRLRSESQGIPYGYTAVLVGTLAYVFSGYAIFAGIRHPYFINPMIYFPLILIGVEKVMAGEKPHIFILSVFIAALSNFYFLYMLAVLTILYTIWRLFSIDSFTGIKVKSQTLLKLSCYAVLSACMSAVILLPAVIGFLGSNRTGSGHVSDLFYSLSDYETTIGAFLSFNTGWHDWTILGYLAVILIAVMLLFIRKEHRNFKIAVLILTIMSLLPFFGKMMNGFSYAANRWIWGYTFLLAFILVIEWKDLFSLTNKEKQILFFSLSLYVFLCFVLVKSRRIDTLFAGAVLLLCFNILCFSKTVFNIRTAQYLLIGSMLFNLTGNALFRFSQRNGGYVKEYLAYEGILNELERTEAIAINKVDTSDDFYRYSGTSLTTNGTLYTGLHSTQYYWSLENGNISDYRAENALSDAIGLTQYKDLDSRTMLSTLANVCYYVQDTNLPYGFTLLESINNYESIDDYLDQNLNGKYKASNLTEEEKRSIYDKFQTYQIWSNDYALPFGYTYAGFISTDDYAAMTPLEKQEAMIQGCVIPSEKAVGSAAKITFTGTSIEYEITAGTNAIVEDHSITTRTANATVTLTFNSLPKTETYLYLTGLSFKGMEPSERYTGLRWDLLTDYDKREVQYYQKYYEEPESVVLSISASNIEGLRTSKSLTDFTPKYTWYSDRKDFLIHLGYDDVSKVSATIQFSEPGTYSFDSLEVLCQPMENYPEQVAALAEDVLQQVDFHNDNAAFATNMVSGTIHLDQSKYLLLTIPFAKGWTAYVNGKEQELLKANTMYMALYLEPGEYEIILTYQTPGLKTGFLTSCLGLFIYLLALLYSHRKNKAISDSFQTVN